MPAARPKLARGYDPVPCGHWRRTERRQEGGGQHCHGSHLVSVRLQSPTLHWPDTQMDRGGAYAAVGWKHLPLSASLGEVRRDSGKMLKHEGNLTPGIHIASTNRTSKYPTRSSCGFLTVAYRHLVLRASSRP